jgi:glutamate-1-semialdehyde 2,1-aminomutase
MLLGFDTRSKSVILGVYSVIPLIHLLRAETWNGDMLLAGLAAVVAGQWFLWTLTVVGGRVAYLVWAHGARLALVWFVKLLTDPFTDVVACSPRFLVRS